MALLIERVTVIVNPASRRAPRLVGSTRAAFAAFAARGVHADLVFTERPGHARELACRAAGGAHAVFVLGGDGTVMEVADALAGSHTPLGVLAGGTGNLLARAFRIPFSPRRAIPALLGGDARPIDLGRFESGPRAGGRFAIAAGVGVDATMVAETPARLKRGLGVGAYVFSGTRAVLRAVANRQFFRARVVADDQAIERDAIAVMIANFGGVLGDRITLGPDIRVDDGLLDACIFAPRTLTDALRVAGRLVRRDPTPDPCVSYLRGRCIRIETTPSLPWQADGDLLGVTPLAVRVEPSAVRVLVPGAA